jgi:exopolysaccharide biosynthesis polyprenyl glycosylphosphotransferase
MKNNAALIYSVFLVIGDFLTLLAAFTLAYVLRVKYDPRPLLQQIPAETYFYGFLAVLPLWIIVHAFIGLYRRSTYENRFREFGNLIVGSTLGMLVVIGYDFVIDDTLFPARLVAVYGLLLSFSFLVIFRMLARGIRSVLFSYGIGVNNVLVIGSGVPAASIIQELEDTAHSGHRIVGIVGDYTRGSFTTFPDFNTAVHELRGTNVHSIIQTELYKQTDRNDSIVNYAQTNHISYRFIPGNNELFVGNIEVELFRGTPVVTVHQTALIGWGQIVKRLFDLIVGIILIILTSPLLLLSIIFMKILNPRESVIFKQTRLTQFDRPFTVYKLRSQYKRFDGTTPEQAFERLGKPELAKHYREGGDHLPRDPRIIRGGYFLRGASLDELPQLLNVIKGDISLVGPRALIPEELKTYRHKHHILSVKSGLTGLAQVSGRRDISFEERRKLDAYYVQNWTFWLDIIILLRTLRAVINHVGAK